MSKDMVNNPDHYKSGGMEAIDVIRAFTEDLRGMEAVDTGNVLKYMLRWKKKNGLEDLKKARWYLNDLIGEVSDTDVVSAAPFYKTARDDKGIWTLTGADLGEIAYPEGKYGERKLD